MVIYQRELHHLASDLVDVMAATRTCLKEAARSGLDQGVSPDVGRMLIIKLTSMEIVLGNWLEDRRVLTDLLVQGGYTVKDDQPPANQAYTS